MKTPNPENVQVAASSLAWTMFHFRELLDDDAYAAILPHFEALTDVLAPAPETVAPADPRDPAVIAIVASA